MADEKVRDESFNEDVNPNLENLDADVLEDESLEDVSGGDTNYNNNNKT
jgi:hypothetical protein